MDRRLSSPRLVLTLALTLSCSLAAQLKTNVPVPKGSQTVSITSLLVPEKAWKHLDIAVQADRAGRDQECEREIDAALQISPRFAQPHLLRAMRNLEAKRYQAAIASAVLAQQIDSRLPLAATIIAGAHNSLGRFHDALLVLDTIHGADADGWRTHFERTRALVGLQDGAGALRASAQTLRTAPAARLDVHLLRANALNLNQRFNESIAELESYLASPEPQPQRADVLAFLATTRQLARDEDRVEANAKIRATTRAKADTEAKAAPTADSNAAQSTIVASN